MISKKTTPFGLAMAAVIALVFLGWLVALAEATDPVRDIDVTIEQIGPDKEKLHRVVHLEVPSGGEIDEIRFEVGKAAAKAAVPVGFPAGWGFERDGRKLVLSGPAVTPPVRWRLDLGAAELRDEVEVEVFNGGRAAASRQKLRPRHVPAMQVIHNLRGIVQLPPRVSPGETVTFTVRDDSQLPPRGTWRLSGVVAEPVEPEGDDDDPAAYARTILNTTRSNIVLDKPAKRPPPPSDEKPKESAPTEGGSPRPNLDPGTAGHDIGKILEGVVYEVTVPENLEPGDTVPLTLTDLWGDLAVDVLEVPEVEVVPAETGDAAPRLHAMPRFAFPGEPVCVCGRFPTPLAWAGLTLDGARASFPISASSRTVFLELPPTLGLGEHVLAGLPEAGYPEGESVATQVIQIAGSLDSEKLLRGESTPMRLRVEGTTEPVELRIQNLTPSIITIEGGEDQVAATSGGGENTLVRSVQGHAKGQFDIRWTFPGPACPCAGERR